MSVTRRGFFRGLGAGAAAVGVAGTTRSAAADARRAFSPLVGRSFLGATVESAEYHLGAIALLLRDDDGVVFQIDVLRADPSHPGVRDVAGLSFCLANRGNGRSQSNEAHGRSLMALADVVADEGVGNVELMTRPERVAAHPTGNFSVA